MKIGILGTGVVGQTIGSALISNKHLVRMGARTYNNEKAETWVKNSNDYASTGDFNDAANFGDLIFLCLNGAHAIDAVRSIEPASIAGKIVVDVTNTLDFSRGMPPRLIHQFSGNTSLGEQIQDALPGAMVVKAFNTVNCDVMVKPKLVNGGDHTLLICGDNEGAKNQVQHFLVDEFGWKAGNIIDLGGIQAARVTEAYVPLWATLYGALGTPHFSIKVVK